ncbi:MAG: class I SAM-dependent methyltransferase [Armatimonadota bacterium]
MNIECPRADYSVISKTYDSARKLPDSSIDQWVDLIMTHGGISRDSLFLDLGCGTGRFTIPVAESTGAYAVGADLSADMLSEAAAKYGADHIRWVRCNALSLPFRPGVFQCVFMSMVLHHLDDIAGTLNECCRILKHGGSCLIRTCSHEDMDSMPVYRWFPRAYSIDRARLPSTEDIERYLIDAGFKHAGHETVIQGLVSSVDQYLDKMRRKAISTLTFLTDEEFADGLSKMETHFREIGEDAALNEVMREPLTLVYAVK